MFKFYGAQSLRIFHLGLCLLSLFSVHVFAVGKTNIFINDIPLYSSLAQCAQDGISAIIRAQSSGCFDDKQSTSFSCFCIDSSTQFASIISTAVQTNCATPLITIPGMLPTSVRLRRQVVVVSTNTGSPEILPTAAAQVSSALEVFHSYCAKSTMIVPSESTRNIALATATSNPALHLRPSTPPIAAIVVPIIIVPLACIAAIIIYLNRRRNATKPREHDIPFNRQSYIIHSTDQVGDNRKGAEVPVTKEVVSSP